MDEIAAAFAAALRLLLELDPELVGIVRLSLAVSVTAVLLAALAGLPLGALLALARFPGRGAVVVLLNACMGLPPVVVGLLVYLTLSRAGPLGAWGLLFTPTAMVAAQTLLVLPIVAALTRQVVEDLWREYAEQFRSLDVGPLRAASALLWDGRLNLLTVLLAGFGRAAAEVGAVLLVGGNIRGATRTMTTAITLETSRGDLALALGLGLVLVLIVTLVNATAAALGGVARRRAAAGAPG
jgi:tungstate transport system permease protein